MARKPLDELPTHYLQWHDKDGKPRRVWRVRLLNSHGYTRQDGKRYFHVIPDPNKHGGLHLISNVPEERLRLIVIDSTLEKSAGSRSTFSIGEKKR